jgi:D-cysteine desulfhydrase
MTAPVLFERFGSALETLPWIELTRLPTPIMRALSLEKHLQGVELWVKRDDISGILYGGNKARKLSFLLGDALYRRAKTVICFGAWGSNHALATAIYARHLGLKSVCILVPEPLNDDLKHNFALIQDIASRIVLAKNSAHAVLLGIYQWLRCLVMERKPPYLIWPGGSSPYGCLGYVDAALELAKQIADGGCAEPDDIYVAVGSNGTLAGLLVGCKIAGLRCRLHGVQVSNYPFVTAKGIVNLANRCCRLLESAIGQKLNLKVTTADFEFVQGFMGSGYARPTPEATRARVLMHKTEGIALEEVYTAKALAALMARSQHCHPPRRVLFWNTYNSQPLEQ